MLNISKKLFLLALLYALSSLSNASAQTKSVKIGIATILSGDLAVLGDNIQKSIQAYKALYPDSRLEFVFEDARLSSTDGLNAYQKLINSDHVNLAIAACTSNATMAATSLFKNGKVPVISVSTGGAGIDDAGDFVFRIGNSDSLNGSQQAEYFASHGLSKVAVLTEQTEYTQDITRFFLSKFKELGGNLIFNEEFTPGSVDFRTTLIKIRQTNPQAIFIPTQTGTALGIILKQWHDIAPDSKAKIHTTFVAAPNRDAHEVAGPLIIGVYYMEPSFSETNQKRRDFFEKYHELFNSEPSVPFQAAGIGDTLNLISQYMESHENFDQESFRKFLLTIKDYDGMLGKITFDEKGNTAIGFRIKRIEKNLLESTIN